MVDQTEDTTPAIANIIAAVQAQDNTQIAQALANLVHESHSKGMDADQINELLEQNGIRGGDALKQFIVEQLNVISQA